MRNVKAKWFVPVWVLAKSMPAHARPILLRESCLSPISFFSRREATNHFIISHLWLTSHPRSTYVLQDTRTLGNCRVNSVRMHRVRLELATSWFENQVPSLWAKQLKSYSPEEVEFIYIDGALPHYYYVISQDMQNICTSRMRSRSQMRYDKIITMQGTIWINPTPSGLYVAFELYSSEAKHLVFKPRSCEFELHSMQTICFLPAQDGTTWLLSMQVVRR